ESDAEADGQYRSAVGTVLAAADEEWRYLQLQSGEFLCRREEHGLQQRAGGLHCPGRQRLSGTVGHEQPLQPVGAAHRTCVRSIGRWQDGDPRVVWDLV